jgi:transcriptional regulator with XRE-family HTH domain
MDIDFLKPKDDHPEDQDDQPEDVEEPDGLDLGYLDLAEPIDEPMGNVWAHLPTTPPRVVARRRAVLAELGRAHLHLRIYRGWSQLDVERRSGVDQTTISRFERGDEQGLSIHRLAATLEALGVGEIGFLPPPGPPPTALELMLYRDRWRKAGDAAADRLSRPKRHRR